MGAIFSLMQKYFRQQNWHSSRVDQRTVLRLRYQGKSGEYTCYAQERGDTGQFIFYVEYPHEIPGEHLKATTELITRVNYGLVVGNFELDLVDGELRYKASLDMEGEKPTMGLIHRIVSACVNTMDHYQPAIERVLRGEISPSEAAEQADDGKQG